MNNDLIDVKTLKPLTRLIYTIGELPTSYLMSMTYEEQLIWLCNYLSQTVIPALNNNGLAVQELQTKYIELKSYIDNYFDNLDVQDEVDNKINAMIEDGTFDTIINQELFGQINDSITNLTNENERLSETTFETPVFPGFRTLGNHAKAVFYDKTNYILNVCQKTNGGYLLYELNKSNGDTSDNSVGLSWDLIRLKKIQTCLHAYACKNDYDDSTGTITTLIDESETANALEFLLFSNGFGKTISGSKIHNKGIRVLGLSPEATITYNMKTTQNNKGNILFYCSSLSSNSVNVYINDNLVIENLDLSSYALTGNNPYLCEFEIPSASSLKDYTIKIENADLTKTAYIACVNYYELENYNGEYIDSFKAILVNEYFINHNGASDYAIKDVDLNKYCGSYHGGEIAVSQKLMVPYPSTQVVQYWKNNYRYMEISSLTGDLFFLTPYFSIEQITNINNKANMISQFDFTNDSMIDMNFEYYNGTIKTNLFYTGLTCNNKIFDVIKNPNNIVLQTGNNYLNNNNGLLMFRGQLTNLKMNIYYSKFNNNYIKNTNRNGWVQVSDYYNKFYFGAIDDVDSEGITPNNLQFRKIIESNII